MRLQSTIDLFLRGEAIHREPSFWERVRRAVGGKVDISTDCVRVALEATAVVDQVRRVFTRLGVTDALSLVIDDEVLFRDTEGRPDDLGDLVLALAEHASVFGQGSARAFEARSDCDKITRKRPKECRHLPVLLDWARTTTVVFPSQLPAPSP
jgi:hypothetical protein